MTIKVQPQVDSEIAKPPQQVTGEDNVKVGIGENTDEALNSAVFLKKLVRNSRCGLKSLCQALKKDNQILVFIGSEGMCPVAKLPMAFAWSAFRGGLWLAFPSRAVSWVQAQRSGDYLRIDIGMTDVEGHAVVEVLQG